MIFRGRGIWRQYSGKLRRFLLAHTKRGRVYIERMLPYRRGECARCGTCCYLGHRCLFVRFENGLAACTIHNHRPQNCRMYPVGPRDIAERDLLDMGKPCGYSFVEIPPGEPRNPFARL